MFLKTVQRIKFGKFLETDFNKITLDTDFNKITLDKKYFSFACMSGNPLLSTYYRLKSVNGSNE